MNPDQLRKEREALELTREQLAEVLGVSWRTVEQWEQGRREIPAVAIKALEYWKELRRLKAARRRK